jgi:hypothetical protein
VSDAGPQPGPGAGIPYAAPRRRGPRGELGVFLVAFVPGALIVVATFFLYEHAADRQIAAVSALCQSEAGRVQEELARVLDQRAAAMERLAAERAEGTEGWRAEAEALAAGPLELRAVLDYDSTLVLGRVLPAGARLLSALDPHDDETRRIALRVATFTPGREAVTVSTARLGSGERQVLACAPVVREGRRRGWIVGVMRLSDVVDAGLQRTIRAGFAAGVLEGPALLYGAHEGDAGRAQRYAREATVVRGPLIWTVEVWPDEELTGELEPHEPAELFVAGMLLACFVSASVYLWRERVAGVGAERGGA